MYRQGGQTVSRYVAKPPFQLWRVARPQLGNEKVRRGMDLCICSCGRLENTSPVNKRRDNKHSHRFKFAHKRSKPQTHTHVFTLCVYPYKRCGQSYARETLFRKDLSALVIDRKRPGLRALLVLN